MAKQATSVAVSGTEATLIEIKDPRYLEKSQVSVYLKFDTFAGGATEVKVRYYYSFDGGTTYYQVPVINAATGAVTDLPDLVASGGPATIVRDIPVSASNAMKITGQTDSGTANLNTGTVMVRDN